MTSSGNLVKTDKREIPRICSLSGHEHSRILENAVLEREYNYITHEAPAVMVVPAIWVNNLLVWHSSPRVGKNEAAIFILSLNREQGVRYKYMMGGAWKKTEKTTL